MRLAMLVLSAGALAAGSGPVTPQQAEQLHQKLLLIVNHSGSAQGRRTLVTEPELNSYLRYRITPTLPSGVTEPTVTLVGNGRMSGRAIVDLDVMRQKQSSGGWLDPSAYLTGKMPITATGTLVTEDGEGRFVLETAEVSGVPVPKSLVQQIVAHFTRTAENPSGISFDQPFDLPAHIKQIDVDQGQAVVVQ